MKGIIVREIIDLVLRPQAAPAAPTPGIATASAGKHIRFTDAEPSKPKPKAVPTDKKIGGNVHARYYSTVTFNQIVLTPADRPVALQLIDVYFEIFKELLGEGVDEDKDVQEHPGAKDEEKGAEEVKMDKGGRILEAKRKGKGKGKQMEIKGAAGFTEIEDSNSKLISAILTGVNRALPFAKIEASDVSSVLFSLQKRVHSLKTPGLTSISTLSSL
jgi:ribosome biogenesis protein MAK21